MEDKEDADVTETAQTGDSPYQIYKATKKFEKPKRHGPEGSNFSRG